MSKGYWIAHVTVTDMDKYQGYVALTPAAFGKFGGKFLARGGKHEVLEGEGRARNVIIEFPSFQAAIDCFHSPEYAAAKAKRAGAGIADIVVIEGVA